MVCSDSKTGSRDCQSWSSGGNGHGEREHKGACHGAYRGTVLATRGD